ncbi:hypothetical protein D9758_010888 [Tetrapyrgos nigripes]|uniref:Protein kinase domain-containing protein n=1 Tax=Tetrapyrgos nigripes TaxID=182062 RepID=A0A8H5CWJ1_9AGAR|nr:hypothetical protein D9758_010888 [Tetrapyrgos nigripes]
MTHPSNLQSISHALDTWVINDDIVDDLEERQAAYHDPDSNTWRKRKSRNELETYQVISPHPRILPIIGIDKEGYAVFKYQCNGDLWRFLAKNFSTPSNVPITTRIVWAVEIAQGLAHLHHKKVVWADAHLANILLSDEGHALLCDFAFSVRNPKFFHSFRTVPPPIFFCPKTYYGIQPTHVDIFSFAIIFFVLLDYRFPFTEDVTPNQEVQDNTVDKHIAKQFDVLRDAVLHKYFGEILDDCFHVRIVTGDVLVQRLLDAHAKWFSETGQVVKPDVSFPQEPEIIPIVPVPLMQMFPVNGENGWSHAEDDSSDERLQRGSQSEAAF